MTHTSTQQPEALNLEEFRVKVTHAAREPLLARIAELEAQLAAAPQAVQRIKIDFKQATELLAMFGGEPTEYTLVQGEGHGGRGLYVYSSEYPEDGAGYLGESDAEAVPDTHLAQQWMDERLLSLDAELLVEAKRAIWRLSQDYEDGELRLRAQERLERIDERRCVGRENIFNSHATLAPQAKLNVK